MRNCGLQIADCRLRISGHWSLVTGAILCWSLVTGQWSRAAGGKTLTLATTTSTYDSGLLDALLPLFEKQSGIKVKVIAVGTGQALAVGRRGDCDVVLVHSRRDEDKFVKQGYGVNRKDVFYNDFVIVGPPHDPARIKGERSSVKAFAKIAQAKATFISRGDDSGTQKKEKMIWKTAKVEPRGEWYLSAGAGMADVLRLADEKNAYTLSDRSTYLVLKSKVQLTVLCEGDKTLFNPYGVIAVNPKRFPHVNYAGAMKFIRFLLSSAAQKVIVNFGREKFGQPLFFTYPKVKTASTRR